MTGELLKKGAVLLDLPSSGPKITVDSQLHGQILGGVSQCSLPGTRRDQEHGSVARILSPDIFSNRR